MHPKKPEEQVTVWIGKNKHIGIILPHNNGSQDEWEELHNEIAEIMARVVRAASVRRNQRAGLTLEPSGIDSK